MFCALCALMVLFCHSAHLQVASRLVRTSLLVFENLRRTLKFWAERTMWEEKSTNTWWLLRVDIVQKQLVGWKAPSFVSRLLISAGALMSFSLVLWHFVLVAFHIFMFEAWSQVTKQTGLMSCFSLSVLTPTPTHTVGVWE